MTPRDTWVLGLALAGLLGACTAGSGKDTEPADGSDPDLLDDTSAPDSDDPGDTDSDEPGDTDPDTDETGDPTGGDTDTDVAALPAWCQPGAMASGAPRSVTSATGDLATAVEGLSAMSWNLFSALDDGNQVISPLSVASVLALVREGAAGDTRAQLDTLLGVTLSDTVWRTQLSGLLQDVGGVSQAGGAQVQLAQRLYGDPDGVTFSPSFLATSAQGWGAPLEVVDYDADPDAVAEQINAWVSDQTCAEIPQLYGPGSFDTSTALVLVNAIFAEADWDTPFDPNLTQPRPFTRADGSVVNPETMSVWTSLPVHETGDLTVARIPVQGGELGFWVVLPDAPDGLADVEDTWTPALLDSWTAQAQHRFVELWMPNHTITVDHDLKPVLQGLGVQDLFDVTSADLSGMTTDPNDLFAAGVVQDATITFDEEGLRAAAATGVTVINDTAATPEPLHLDRPHLWVLRDELTGLVLFMGRTTDPTAP